MTRNLLAWIFVFILIQPVKAQESGDIQKPAKVVVDVLYRESEGLDEYSFEKCRLDIHRPDNAENLPVVVWFHGGGLTKGKKSIPKALMDQGLVVVAAGYRLSPQVKSPVFIQDAAAAVAWTIGNIQEYGGDPKRVFVSGHSAGGYLSMMVGLDPSWLETHAISTNQLCGLIPFSGQAITHFTIRGERGIPETQPVVDALAPMFHVRKDAPPILMITGDRNQELLGRYEENAYMWRMFKQVEHPDAELFELQGFDHGGMAEPAFPLLLKFVRRHSDSEK